MYNESERTPQPEVFLALQLILDKRERLVAYELLFRNSNANAAKVVDDTHATAQVINYAFSNLDVGDALGKYTFFINVAKEMLASDMIEFLAKKRITLEILETVDVDEKLIERCKDLKEKGFRLALDDYTHTSAYEPLLKVVDIVKVDLTLQDWPSTLETVRKLKAFPVRLLAEKVETHEQFQQCVAAGFDLFQGYYFARPHMVMGKHSNPSQQVAFRLLGLILNDVSDGEIEAVLKQDPALCLSLFRLVNSAALGLRTKISSFRQALTVLGRRQLQRWLQLLLYTHQSAGKDENPLIGLAARRGKLMELLTQSSGHVDDETLDRAFMTGIFSLLDALLDRPLVEMIDILNPADEITEALLEKKGNLGQLLSLIEMTECGDFAHASGILQAQGLTVQQLMDAEIEALRWATSLKNLD